MISRARLRLARRAPSPVVVEYVLGTLLVALLLSGSVASIRRALTRLSASRSVRRARPCVDVGPHRSAKPRDWPIPDCRAQLRACDRDRAGRGPRRARGADARAARPRVVEAGRLDDAEDALGAALPALAGDRFRKRGTRAHVASCAGARSTRRRARVLHPARGAVLCARATDSRSISTASCWRCSRLARGVDATAEIEAPRGRRDTSQGPGLEAALVLAEAHARARCAARGRARRRGRTARAGGRRSSRPRRSCWMTCRSTTGRARPPRASRSPWGFLGSTSTSYSAATRRRRRGASTRRTARRSSVATRSSSSRSTARPG